MLSKDRAVLNRAYCATLDAGCDAGRASTLYTWFALRAIECHFEDTGGDPSYWLREGWEERAKDLLG